MERSTEINGQQYQIDITRSPDGNFFAALQGVPSSAEGETEEEAIQKAITLAMLELGILVKDITS